MLDRSPDSILPAIACVPAAPEVRTWLLCAKILYPNMLDQAPGALGTLKL